MKTPFTILTCCLLLATISSGAEEGGTSVALSLASRTAEVSVGTFLDTETREVRVQIHNDGKEALEIKEIKVSCDCTASDFVADIVKPGDRYTFNLSVAKPYAIKPINVDSTAVVESSGGVFAVHLIGKVNPTLSVKPWKIEIQRNADGSLPEVMPPIMIESQIGHSIKPVSLKSVGNLVQYEEGWESAEGEHCQIHWSLKPEVRGEQRNLADSIQIAFQHGERPYQVEIPLEVVGNSALIVEPDRVNLGLVSSDTPIKGFFLVSSRQLGKRFQLKQTASDSAQVSISRQEISPGKFRVDYKFTPQSSEEASSSAIQIPVDLVTNDPAASEARIYLIGAQIHSAGCCGRTIHHNQ